MDKKRELAARIVDLFDDLLYQKGIEVPCEDSNEQAERHEGVTKRVSMAWSIGPWLTRLKRC